MKKLLSATLVAAATLCLSGVAAADSIAEVFSCKVEEGKKLEDVQAANGKWLKWVNANLEGGGITSSVGTAVVGDSDTFIFVDSYPDLSTWAAAKELLDSDAAEDLEEVFEGVSDCSENRLWKLESTKE